MDTLLKALRNELEPTEILGEIPNLDGGRGIIINKPNQNNEMVYKMMNQISVLRAEMDDVNRLYPEAAKALSWDWEVEFEHRVSHLGDDAIVAMCQDIRAKKSLMASVYGLTQALECGYPEQWIDLTQENLQLWVEEVNRKAMEELFF